MLSCELHGAFLRGTRCWLARYPVQIFFDPPGQFFLGPSEPNVNFLASLCKGCMKLGKYEIEASSKGKKFISVDDAAKMNAATLMSL